jgi:hypothetical protein
MVTFLRWAGRVLVLLAVAIGVCALFAPEVIAPLEPLVCPDGTTLDNERYRPPFAPGEGSLELVCTSPFQTESAFVPVALLVVGLIAVGLAGMYVAERRSHPGVHVRTGT